MLVVCQGVDDLGRKMGDEDGQDLGPARVYLTGVKATICASTSGRRMMPGADPRTVTGSSGINFQDSEVAARSEHPGEHLPYHIPPWRQTEVQKYLLQRTRR